MRLLNTKTITLEDYFGKRVPPYVILSHTWGEEEVLLEDIRNASGRSKKAWRKITGACDKAREHGYSWIWIDTCCIDKSSSAELSEAINSMFKWYKVSEVCHVYLQDISTENDVSGSSQLGFAEFLRSRWFSRGWTLQELIAPTNVRFYAANWEELGTRRSLANGISQRTNIPLEVLDGQDPFARSVAERMSWAADRETTRREDEAYCLLGLFGVNMPLLYGEGPAAFQRLQKQILSDREDYSLLLWVHQKRGRPELPPVRGCLAAHPNEFRKLATLSFSLTYPLSQCHISLNTILDSILPNYKTEASFNSVPMMTSSSWSIQVSLHSYAPLAAQLQLEPGLDVGEPPSVTSRGLRLELPVYSVPYHQALACLHCKWYGMLVCIAIKQVNKSSIVYVRNAADVVILLDRSYATKFSLKKIYLQYAVDSTEVKTHNVDLRYEGTLNVHAGSLKGPPFRVIQSEPMPQQGGIQKGQRPYQEYKVVCLSRAGLWNISVFEVGDHGYYAWVLVVCGRHNGRLWCNIRCKPDPNAAIDLSSSILSEFYKSIPSRELQPDMLTHLGIDASRDRDVKTLPLRHFDLGTVSIDENAGRTEYHLKVRFENSSRCEPWARLLLDS